MDERKKGKDNTMNDETKEPGGSFADTVEGLDLSDIVGQPTELTASDADVVIHATDEADAVSQLQELAADETPLTDDVQTEHPQGDVFDELNGADLEAVFDGMFPEKSSEEPVHQSVWDEAADDYSNSMTTIKSHPDYQVFQAGFYNCLNALKAFVADLDNDDGVALLFQEHFITPAQYRADMLQEVGDVQHFVEAADAGATIIADNEKSFQELTQQGYMPAPGTPSECPTCGSPKPRLHPAMQFEGEVQMCTDPWHGVYGKPEHWDIMKSMVGGSPLDTVGRDTQVVGKSIEGLDVEKVLREQQTEIERLTQLTQRQDEAILLWADCTDFFNDHLSGEPEGDLNVSLLERMKAYVDRLEDYDGELPPSLAGFLKGQPEADTALQPVGQLALLIQRLQRDALVDRHTTKQPGASG
jgi:hypothetical protein